MQSKQKQTRKQVSKDDMLFCSSSWYDVLERGSPRQAKYENNNNNNNNMEQL